MSTTTTTVIPHLACRNAGEAVEFYQRALGAELQADYRLDDGRVMHACFKIGGGVFFICDEFPEHGGKSPEALGGSPVTIHLQVPDVDATYAKAIEAGFKPGMPVQDMFWGDRYGTATDPFGHNWSFATNVRTVSKEEMEGIMSAMSKGEMPGCGEG